MSVFKPGLSRISYKRTLDEEEPFVVLNWQRRKSELPKMAVLRKYHSPNPISKEKKADLPKMLPQIQCTGLSMKIYLPIQ